MAVAIVLTEQELLMANVIASVWSAQDRAEDLKETYGAEGYSIDKVIVGMLGELAVAKFLGVYWSGNLGNFHAKDVGGIQVRSSARDEPSLILHDRDSDDDLFILCKVGSCFVEIQGWLCAKDGKHDWYWRENVPHPAYFVPAGHLHDPEELLELWTA